MSSKALQEIKESKPYIELLSRKNINEELTQSLISNAPNEFYSVITQTARPLLNKNICVKNSNFC